MELYDKKILLDHQNIEEATKLHFKIDQVFESAEECKRTIKYFAQPLGFVASINGQSLVCNRSDVLKKRKQQL